MIWKLLLALIEVTTIVARQVSESRSEHAAAAKMYLRMLEKANAAIARAEAARKRQHDADAADPGGLRAPDPDSRD